MADRESISVTIVNKKMVDLRLTEDSLIEDLNRGSKLSITIEEGIRKVTPSVPSQMEPKFKTEGDKVVEMLESTYLKKRLEILEPNGMYNSPLGALTKLTRKYNMSIINHVYRINLPDSRKWEMQEQFIYTVRVGLVYGKGQSNDERMAKMLACTDLLKKLDVNNEEVFGLHPGSRASKMVFVQLAAICTRQRLPFPKFSVIASTEPISDQALFTVTLKVGNKIIEVSGDDLVCAKRKAALDMVELIGAKTLPLVIAKIGDEVDSELPVGYLPKQTNKKRKALDEEFEKYASQEKYDDEMVLKALNPQIFTEVQLDPNVFQKSKQQKLK